MIVAELVSSQWSSLSGRKNQPIQMAADWDSYHRGNKQMKGVGSWALRDELAQDGFFEGETQGQILKSDSDRATETVVRGGLKTLRDRQKQTTKK